MLYLMVHNLDQVDNCLIFIYPTSVGERMVLKFDIIAIYTGERQSMRLDNSSKVLATALSSRPSLLYSSLRSALEATRPFQVDFLVAWGIMTPSNFTLGPAVQVCFPTGCMEEVGSSSSTSMKPMDRPLAVE